MLNKINNKKYVHFNTKRMYNVSHMFKFIFFLEITLYTLQWNVVKIYIKILQQVVIHDYSYNFYWYIAKIIYYRYIYVKNK